MKYITLTLTLLVATLLATQDHRGPDGHYHDPNTGEIQPDRCSNLPDEPHPCDGTDSQEITGEKCKTYCRPKACLCQRCCPDKPKGA
jgi:hypothetical protein